MKVLEYKDRYKKPPLYYISPLAAPGNPTILAPVNTQEGSTVTFNCTTIGGNPLPSVTWYKGNTPVDSTYSTGTQSGTTMSYNEYTFTASRNDDDVSYKCEVDNIALSNPIVRTWKMAVYGKWISISYKVLLHCIYN